MENTFQHAAQMVRSWLTTTKHAVAAQKIAAKLFEIDTETSLLVHPDKPGAASINSQRLFRVKDGLINGRTPAQRIKFMALLPAIERVLIEDDHIRLVMKMRSHASETIGEMVKRRERIDGDMDALMLFALERHFCSGPAGSSLRH